MVKKRRRRQGQGARGTPRRRVTRAETYGAVQLEFLRILAANPTATVDAVHDRLEIPDSARMRIGAAIRGLKDAGRIKRVAFRKTQRGKAHGRQVTVWRLAE